jgi:sulfatase modifying factor 1
VPRRWSRSVFIRLAGHPLPLVLVLLLAGVVVGIYLRGLTGRGPIIQARPPGISTEPKSINLTPAKKSSQLRFTIVDRPTFFEDETTPQIVFRSVPEGSLQLTSDDETAIVVSAEFDSFAPGEKRNSSVNFLLDGAVLASVPVLLERPFAIEKLSFANDVVTMDTQNSKLNLRYDVTPSSAYVGPVPEIEFRVSPEIVGLQIEKRSDNTLRLTLADGQNAPQEGTQCQVIASAEGRDVAAFTVNLKPAQRIVSVTFATDNVLLNVQQPRMEIGFVTDPVNVVPAVLDQLEFKLSNRGKRISLSRVNANSLLAEAKFESSEAVNEETELQAIWKGKKVGSARIRAQALASVSRVIFTPNPIALNSENPGADFVLAVEPADAPISDLVWRIPHGLKVSSRGQGSMRVELVDTSSPAAAGEFMIEILSGGAPVGAFMVKVETKSNSKANAGKTLTFDNAQFVWCPPGVFEMGASLSPSEIAARYGGPPAAYQDEIPRHMVTLTRGFWIGKYEVTNSQFGEFVDSENYRTGAELESGLGSGWVNNEKTMNERRGNGLTWRTPGWQTKPEEPVVQVSWNDCNRYCEWLSRRTGRHYRLPTEAEWEYACRAGTTTTFQWGDNFEDGKGWCNGPDISGANAYPVWTSVFPWADGYVYVAPVGSFKPNAWGIHDMLGNVLEWVHDLNGPYSSSAVVDPLGKSNGLERIGRGGSWALLARSCRSSMRTYGSPNTSHNFLGFRVCFSP